MLELVDIGCNLADRAFASDREEVIRRAIDAGVCQMVLTGTTVDESRAALEIARAREGALFCTAGVHPHYVRECGDRTLDALRDLHREPAVVAMGECGLDFFRDLSPRDVQEQWFVAQIELGAELGKPLFVHDRQAFDRCHAILEEHRSKFSRAVVHCFTAGERELRGYLDLDLHIGITGWVCDERRGTHLREIVRYVPTNRLMIETDAPYLLPRTIRPKPKSRRNEPALLPWVLDELAACRAETREQLAESSTAVAREFFGLR